MKLLTLASTVTLAALALSGCMQANGAAVAPTGPDDLGKLAPPVPKDDRSHGDFQKMTGINGDAIAAISGTPAMSYIYYDPVAANHAALPNAPAKLCQSYGKKLKTFRTTQPADRAIQPGMDVLAVQCSG